MDGTLPCTRTDGYLSPDFLVCWDFLSCDGFADPRQVHQVLVVQVLGDGVAAPGPAPERRRGREPVRERAAGGQGGSLVDDEAADRQLNAHLADVILVVRVQRRRVPGSFDQQV